MSHRWKYLTHSELMEGSKVTRVEHSHCTRCGARRMITQTRWAVSPAAPWVTKNLFSSDHGVTYGEKSPACDQGKLPLPA